MYTSKNYETIEIPEGVQGYKDGQEHEKRLVGYFEFPRIFFPPGFGFRQGSLVSSNVE